MPEARMSCKWCSHVSGLDEIIKAPSPFDAEDILSGCPACWSVNDFERLCDHPGCPAPASCGTPSADGYQHTCYKHRPSE